MQRDIHLSTLYALYVHLKKSLKYVETVQDKFRRVASSMSDFSFLCFSTFPCFSGTSMASASLSPGLGQSPPQAPPSCWSSQTPRAACPRGCAPPLCAAWTAILSAPGPVPHARLSPGATRGHPRVSPQGHCLPGNPFLPSLHFPWSVQAPG